MELNGKDLSTGEFSAFEVYLQETSPNPMGNRQESGCFYNFDCKSEKKTQIWKPWAHSERKVWNKVCLFSQTGQNACNMVKQDRLKLFRQLDN